MNVRIIKLAVFAAVEVDTAVFTGIRPLNLVGQLRFKATGMAVENRRVHALNLNLKLAADKLFPRWHHRNHATEIHNTKTTQLPRTSKRLHWTKVDSPQRHRIAKSSKSKATYIR